MHGGDDENNDPRSTIHDPRDLAGATRDERGSAISNEIIGERIDHKGGRIIDRVLTRTAHGTSRVGRSREAVAPATTILRPNHREFNAS